MPVYRVVASRTELVQIEAYIRAKSRDEAEDKFWAGAFEEGTEVLQWDEDYDGSETDIDTIDAHTLASVPILEYRQTDPYCRLCGVRLEQVDATVQSSSGQQEVTRIWIHVQRSTLDEGVGL